MTSVSAQLVPTLIVGGAVSVLMTYFLWPILPAALSAIILSLSLHRIKNLWLDKVFSVATDGTRNRRVAIGPVFSTLVWNGTVKTLLGQYLFHIVNSFVVMWSQFLSKTIIAQSASTAGPRASTEPHPPPSTPKEGGDHPSAQDQDKPVKPAEETHSTANEVQDPQPGTALAVPQQPHTAPKTHLAITLLSVFAQAAFVSLIFDASWRWTVVSVVVPLVAGSAVWTVAVPASFFTTEHSREWWNTKITTWLILGGTILVLSSGYFFADLMLDQAAPVSGSVIEFLADKPAVYNPHSSSFLPSLIPQFGIHKSVVAKHFPAVRTMALSKGDSTLKEKYPEIELAAIDAVNSALGGWYVYLQEHGDLPANSSVSVVANTFRSRFPQTTVTIAQFAHNQRFSAFLSLGAAIGEIRWMGPSAVSPEITTTTANATKDSLDPTPAAAQAIGLFAIDLLFQSLVFYSTLWVLTASEQGLRGYIVAVLGEDLGGKALLDPLTNCVNLSPLILVSRLLMARLVSVWLFPNQAAWLSSVMPILAFYSVWAPALPPLFAIALPASLALYIFHAAPIRAIIALVAFVWYFGEEPAYVESALGTDGIGILDAFSIWMGWFALGPAGLVFGPWAFVAARRVYQVLVKQVTNESREKLVEGGEPVGAIAAH